MTLSIQLGPDVEARLKDAAERLGVDASEYARRLIEQSLPARNPPSALHDLFAQWDAEDTTTDPAELETRQREWEEFRNSINGNHSSDRIIYPEPQ